MPPKSNIVNMSSSIQLMSLRNSRAVRWYVLSLPYCHRGRANGLQNELERRIRHGEPEFEYFAPTYVEVKKRNGIWSKTNRPLLYNYVFVRASESEIYRMMNGHLSLYSFLPRIHDGKQDYYPYISDKTMENLRRVADSYSEELPICSINPSCLKKGDRVRIIDGKFKNTEATVITYSGGGKEVLVGVDNWLCVPLLHLTAEQYEVIALSENTSIYYRLNNDSLLLKLHNALLRYHGASLTECDRNLAVSLVREYGNVGMKTDVMRCKLYSLLLPAFRIIGDNTAMCNMVETIENLLVGMKAEQSIASMFVTMFGCTGNVEFSDRAHALVDKWQEEQNLKKSKIFIIKRLEDYDRLFGRMCMK